MTNEEKDILLKDLCMRLPYNPKVRYSHYHSNGDSQDIVLNVHNAHKLLVGMPMYHIRPYLRRIDTSNIQCERWKDLGTVASNIRYLLENHCDFNGLIDKGLAIEAPSDMYKNEQSI